MALIEFYDGAAEHPFAHTNDAAVPRPGDKISIRRQVWNVVAVTWALDQLDGEPARLRANVTVIVAL